MTQKMNFGRRGPGAMGVPVEKPKNGGKTLRRLLSYFGKQRLLVVLLFVIVTAAVALQVAAPSFLSRAIDCITAHSFDRLPKILVLMLIIYALASLCTMAQEILSAHLSQRIVGRLRSDLFSRVIRLPVSYLDGHSRGDLISRMTNDAENISNVVSQSMSSLFSGILTLIGTLTIMLWYSWQLTLLACSTIILSVIFTRILSKLIRRYYVKRQQLLGAVNGIVEEKVTNFKTVAAYSQEEAVVDEFSRTSDELTRTGIIAEIISSTMGPVMNMLNNISFVIVAVFGGYFVIKGTITVGVISAFIIYSKQFSRPINELSQLYGQIQTAIAGAERIFEILDAAPEDKSGHIRMKKTDGVIEFRNVNFSYVPGKPVIRNFNLRVESGKKIALVGSTGSGKTTIVNLLMRFYDVDSGEILLDGVNIRDINCDDLRDLIGIVLQDTILFTDSIRNNLAYARPDASNAEIVQAAKFSHSREMIMALPRRYRTRLTESGGNLSQGQRQLLSIGRAFLSQPSILILDEATSNIDTRTEKHIQDAMIRLMQGRTSLIIAHRLSTIRDADQIVVMDQGSIAETGTHEELLAKGGRYYELYQSQFAGREI